MSKFCPNCGTENDDVATFCKSCGTGLSVEQPAMTSQPAFDPNMNTNNMNGQPNMNNFNGNATGPNLVPFRNLVMSILLSFVTCGIYSIYWFIVMTDDAKKVSNDQQGAGGGMAFLLTLVTCGIYGIYWYYKQGQRLYQAGRNYNVDIKDNSILYLILGIFGLGIVADILIQSDLNKFSAGQ